MFSVPVNYLAILASGIAAFIIGALWYSPLLFGTLWAKEHGFTEQRKKELASSMMPAMVGSFIGYLVTAYIMSLLFHHLNVTTIPAALHWGFLLWLAFPGAIGLMGTLYSGKSFTLYLIDTAYQFAYIEAMAVILTLWK